MTGQQTEAPTDPRVKVARDLTEILLLHAELGDQAEAKATAKVDGTALAGGLAMVALGPVANLEAWGHQQQATERHEAGVEGYRKAYTSAEDEDPEDAWSAFQLLEFWAEQWRQVHGAEYGNRPTIASEVSFIRWALDWAWQNEPGWDAFAADVRQARLRLENILYAGTRVERTRITCDQCDDRPRLIKVYGDADDGSRDQHKCPRCKHRFDTDALRKAHAKMLRSQGAEKWVNQVDAIGTLKAQGRPERTIRQWLADGEGSAYCDPATHTVWVWWPDLWRKHLATPTRIRR